MKSTILLLATFSVLFFAACSGGSDSGSDKTATPADGGSPSATKATGSAPTTTQTAVVLKPSIEEALSCRVPPVRPATGGGTAPLQRQDLDQTAFPGVSCNDGTPAVLNFRPYEGEANRNKWLIALDGGGSCENAQECANRWCGVDTNFDADNMSSANLGSGATDGGMFRRAPENPFGNWNQVEVRYCSSDWWAGTGGAISFTAKDPKTGKDVTYQINFAGNVVYEAVVATLRRDNVQALVYTRNNRRVEMPDLDEASEVVLAGGSAGGAGVINNLDRLADTLRAGRNQPVVRGLIDSVVGPDMATVGYGTSVPCTTNKLCSYEAAVRAAATTNVDVLKRLTDQSCLDWHKKNAPGTEWQCFDPSHVLANHITTPYFVRMGLTDALVSKGYIDAGLAGADGKPFTRASWGLALRDTLLNLQQSVLSGHEKSAITKAPGIFAPSCSTHYTIFNNETTYDVTTNAGGKAYTLFAVWNNWVAGQKPDVVISADPRTDKCTGD